MFSFFRRSNKNRKSRPAARKRRFVRRLPLYLEVLESRVLLSADSWIGGSGNWDTGSNWSLGKAPGTGDTAIINTSSAATITIQSGDDIQVQAVHIGGNDTLSMTGGSLTVTNGLSVNGTLNLGSASNTSTSGQLLFNGTQTIDGTGTINLGSNSNNTIQDLTAGLTIGSGITIQGDNGTISASSLTNNGQILPNVSGGTIAVIFGSNGSNTSTGLLRASNDASLTVIGGDRSSDSFTNSGTIALSGGGTLSINNGNSNAWSGAAGTISVAGSTLILGGSFTQAGLGAFAADAASTVELTGTLSGNLALTGATSDVIRVQMEPNYNWAGTGSPYYYSGVESKAAAADPIFGSDGSNTWNHLAIGGYTVANPSYSHLVDSTGATTNVAISFTGNVGAYSDLPLDGGDPDAVENEYWAIGSNTVAYTISGLPANTVVPFYLYAPNFVHYDSGDPNGQPSRAYILTANGNTIFVKSGPNNDALAYVMTDASGDISGTWSTPYGNEGDWGGFQIAYAAGSWILDGGTLTSGTLTTNGGAALIAANATLNNYTIDGTLAASGNVTLTGTTNWAGGTIVGSGTVTVPSDATLNINSSSGTTLDGTLANQGTIVQKSGTVAIDGSLTNAGTYEVALAASGNLTAGSGSFTNTATGTLKLTTAVTATVASPFDNHGGTVAATAGTLVLSGGTSTGGTTFNVGTGAAVTISSGSFSGGVTFNVAQGATVDLTGGGSTTYGGTLTGSGAGTVLFSGGGLDPATGGLTLNFTGNMFQWTGGAFFASLGDVTNKGTMNLAGPNEKGFYEDGTLYNYGTIIQTGSGNLGLHSDNVSPTTLNNEAGASYLIEGDGGIDNPYGGQVAVQNAGTIKKTAGTGTSTLYINGVLSNTGVIESDSGTLFMRPNSFAQFSGNTFTGGTWNQLNGSSLLWWAVLGSIAVNDANLTFSGSGGGSGASGSLFSSTLTNNGSITIGNGDNWSQPADFTNNGSLTVGSGSTFSVGGNFTQTASGTLNAQVGGTLASGQFGQVAVNGTATLGGNFNVNLPNGFTPARNAVYPVMTFASASGTFATVTGLGSLLTEQLNSTGLDLENGTGTPVDLQLSQATAPTTATTGQPITVNWTVNNSGVTDAAGNWQDSVYLSTTPTITGSSVLLGSVSHSGGLAASDSYNASLTAAMPALPSGNYYVLVQTDSLDQVPVLNRANDILAASTGQLAVSVPALTLGTPSSGTFTAANQDQYYQVTVPSGGSLQVSLTSTASSGALALYVSQGTQPTPYSFQESANLAGQPNQSLNVPVTGPGTYYILVHSVSGPAATAGYTLNVTQTSALTISAPSTAYTGGNGGNLTLDIKGTNFSSNTTASLSLGSTTINATSIYFQSASEIYATFNLSGVATGNYTLTVQNGTQQATAPTTVAVVPASTGNPVQLALATPSLVSAGRDGIVTVTVTNTSNNDVLAPLLFLTTDGATLKLPSQSGFQGATLNFLAVSQTGPAGILTPGESVQVQIQFQSITTNPSINFQLYQADDSQTIDWTAAKNSLQGTIPTEAWNAIWNNFISNVGGTVGSYHTVLANDATYLGQLGQYSNDVNSLFDFELDKAADDFITPTLTTVTDVDFPAPGLPLTFERAFQQPLDRRSTPGPFGLGWTNNWQISLSTDAQGNVTIADNGQKRFFALQSDGSYKPRPGDFASLTLAKGIYQLRETDDTLFVFNSDGSLNYEQDTNGNRISCGYTNDLLTSLTSSDGQQITIAYNSQNLISQVTAPDGQVTSYTYDSDQHLVSYTDQYGTANYTYLNGQTNPAQINALSEIAYADNTHLYFSYDNQGRLIDYHRDNGQEDLSFSYLPVNGYTVTDGDGNTSTYLIDASGDVSEVINPLGQVWHLSYDANSNLTQIAAPQGAAYSFAYDAKGNIVSDTNALGNTVRYTYDVNNNLTSYTDAKGNTTTYNYDANSDLLSITYANGSKQQFSYDPLGEATQYLNARGDAIGYTYNTQGQVLTDTFADGTSFSYTYDSHGNLTSAKDAQGNVTTFVYGDSGNPDLLTEVKYPDSTFLKFSYNIAGQRTQSIDQAGFTINYTYDALGRLSKLTDGNNNLIVQYTYDPAGNLIQKDMGNGTRTVYKYDAAGGLLSITNYAPDHTTVNSFDDYTYDALGNVLTDASQDGTWTYTYDADGQLTQAVFASSNTAVLPNQNLQYVYDAAGNRISETVNGVTTTYAVNNVNEYTSSTTTGVGTTTYQYDADGNLIATTDPSNNTTKYTFNDLNQLTAVKGPNLSAVYGYDPLGNRISQTLNGVTTKFQIDPADLGNVAAAFDGSGNLIAHFTYGFGLVSQVTAGGSTGYYDFNLIGNTVGITGSTGSYINRYAYLPFGQTTTLAAAMSNSFTFVGESGVRDDGSGLIQMSVRDYNPVTGQFVSADPLGLSGGDPNIRRYAQNNPTALIDPSGEGCT